MSRARYREREAVEITARIMRPSSSSRRGAPISWTRAIHHLLRFEVTPRTPTFILLLRRKLSLIYESASSSISSGPQIMWHGAYNLCPPTLWECELKNKLFSRQVQHLPSLARFLRARFYRAFQFYRSNLNNKLFGKFKSFHSKNVKTKVVSKLDISMWDVEFLTG